jgi:hypothetical protein
VALPDYVRAVSKPNGRTLYYYEKFRRTERAWPRVRIPAAPLSEAFARRVTQLPPGRPQGCRRRLGVVLSLRAHQKISSKSKYYVLSDGEI